jgi:uncharacterized protein YecA (UPF0149 family)
MLDFEKFLQSLKDQILQLAKDTVKENWQAAVQDGQNIVDKNEAKLQKWLTMLNNGDLDQEEFTFLCGGLKDLAEMEALRQAGLKAAQIDKFRTQLFALIIDAGFKFIV